MAMEWFRMYHGMPFDTKLRVVAKRAGQPMGVAVTVWACILDAASQHDPRGIAVIDPEEIAVALELETEAVEAVIAAMRDKEMLDEDGHLTAWDIRQRTTSTERMKKLRDKKKGDVTASDKKKQGVTRGDAMRRKKRKISQDTDTDTDTEEITDLDSEKEKDSDKKTEREEKGESERKKHQSQNGKVRKDRKVDSKTKSESNESKNSNQNDTQTPELTPDQIRSQMLEIWNAEVQSKLTKGQKAILTSKRKELLTARWIEDFAEDVRAWKYFCQIIGKSDFCLGKIDGKGWTIDLTWAIHSSDRVAKILEGGFSGGNHPPKPTACEIAEFQNAWDEVIRRMEHHHGKGAISGWFANTTITRADKSSTETILTLVCPRPFIRDWISKHYLEDLNFHWSEINSQQPIRVTLATENAS